MSCALSIELDNPETPRVDGETVSGTVIVKTASPVACKGLEITTQWSTHGRGNVDSADVDRCIAFEGEWEANREYRYPFTLKSAAWPPTYYGTYLNVSHAVKARAKVPWSTDPKAQVEFTVVATKSPEDLKPTTVEAKKSNSIAGWVIGGILIVVFGAFFGVLLLILLPVIGVAAGGYWFFRVFLPKQITGSIECSAEPQRVAPGGEIRGQMRFTPKRNATINGITWGVTCVEKCVSGSGTKKTTHRHEVFKSSERLAEGGTLQAGMPQSFEFAFTMPADAQPSLKFSENELTWEGELRIDIPRWPDWVQTFPLTVTPAAAGTVSPVGLPSGATGRESPADQIVASVPTPEQEAWFNEVIQQLIQSRRDPDRLQLVVDAVRDHVFTIRLDIRAPILRPPDSMDHERGTWIRAHYRPQDVPICLVSGDSRLQPPANTSNWVGNARLLGYDEALGGVVMRLV